jgi:hypothetical protein
MNTTTVCTTCFKHPDAARYVCDERGRVIQGCVGAAHVGRFTGEKARWINRPEAKRIRKALAHIAPTIERDAA